MSGYTKGPWMVCAPDASPPQIIAPGIFDICTMDGAASNPGVMSDAKLIASAPDLLEALIDTLDALECWTGSDIRIEKARAAIKKATE